MSDEIVRYSSKIDTKKKYSSKIDTKFNTKSNIMTSFKKVSKIKYNIFLKVELLKEQ